MFPLAERSREVLFMNNNKFPLLEIFSVCAWQQTAELIVRSHCPCRSDVMQWLPGRETAQQQLAFWTLANSLINDLFALEKVGNDTAKHIVWWSNKIGNHKGVNHTPCDTNKIKFAEVDHSSRSNQRDNHSLALLSFEINSRFKSHSRGSFLESPENFSGPKSHS